MSPILSITSIQFIEERIAPLRAQLAAHPLYTSMVTADHIRTFMEFHVYAVWDFMSLLTALRQKLTCIFVPWRPTNWPDSRRFINEIALGEESDQFEGRAISHFELYLEAMEEAGADSSRILHLLTELERAAPETPLVSLLEHAGVPDIARRFVQSTFDTIQSGSLSNIAAAFTFGREDLIPAMFRELTRDLDRTGPSKLSKFVWYLERHIELDGDDHGPLSLQMVTDLCGSDEKLWSDAASVAEQAIGARLALWDGILASLPPQA